MPRKNNTVKTKTKKTVKKVVVKDKKQKEDTGSFGFAVINFFADYVGWGRARRAEYWWVILFGLIVSWFFDIVCFGSPALCDLYSSLWLLATIVPGFCLAVRRLHDTNRSAWNYCWLLFPIVGWIIFLVYMCQAGTPGKNKYGAPRF